MHPTPVTPQPDRDPTGHGAPTRSVPADDTEATRSPQVQDAAVSSHLALLRLPPRPEDASGHDPRSVYVERFWLGIVGPSVVWFLRLCRRELDSATDTQPAVIDLEDTARQLGLTFRGGRNSSLMRTIDRARSFHLAFDAGPATLALPLLVPSVPRRLHHRLPTPLRSEVQAWTDATPRTLPRPTVERVAQALVDPWPR